LRSRPKGRVEKKRKKRGGTKCLYRRQDSLEELEEKNVLNDKGKGQGGGNQRDRKKRTKFFERGRVEKKKKQNTSRRKKKIDRRKLKRTQGVSVTTKKKKQKKEKKRPNRERPAPGLGKVPQNHSNKSLFFLSEKDEALCSRKNRKALSRRGKREIPLAFEEERGGERLALRDMGIFVKTRKGEEGTRSKEEVLCKNQGKRRNDLQRNIERPTGPEKKKNNISEKGGTWGAE